MEKLPPGKIARTPWEHADKYEHMEVVALEDLPPGTPDCSMRYDMCPLPIVRYSAYGDHILCWSCHSTLWRGDESDRNEPIEWCPSCQGSVMYRSAGEWKCKQCER